MRKKISLPMDKAFEILESHQVAGLDIRIGGTSMQFMNLDGKQSCFCSANPGPGWYTEDYKGRKEFCLTAASVLKNIKVKPIGQCTADLSAYEVTPSAADVTAAADIVAE